ncbi:MAG TPA: LptA/OstA family protein [Candidatus Paceibacterota bacterium]|nr:LptA/OstA family protein [Verrucomicrobiota bacterium]HSA09640.1 LptA/OstA family protein [Candidatus Paceibacterota bacterium]
MNRHIQFTSGAALAMLALGLAINARPAHAQPVVGGQGFKFADYHEAPHDTQMKALIEGAQAQQQADKRWLVTKAKYQTFSPTGEGELVVEAPECLFDPTHRSISSAGPLQVQTANGRFAIKGEGFVRQQTNATLLVSNRVHTTIHPDLLKPAAATPLTNRPAEVAPGMDIFSDQFEYEQTSGKGVYQGNVRVTGTNLNSTAGRLTVLLPMAEHRLQSLTAEERVVVDYEKIHATGEWAFYSADTDLIQMKGQPTWRIEQRQGSGDELIFDRTNRIFRAMGHARLQMPAAGLGAAGFLSPPGSRSVNSPAPANEVVEIQCDNYELRTDVAVFRDQVNVSDRLDGQLQGQMACGLMTLTLAGTNELGKMVAERAVVIAREDRRFTAAKAEYTATNHLLELIGSPAWQAGSREGRGDSIRVNLAREEMLVEGNAFMRLPAAEVGQAALAGSAAPTPGQTSGGAPAFAEIYSQQYLLTPATGLFHGGVRIEHPQMKWTCEELTMLSPPELGKDGRMLIAEPSVVFDLQNAQGQTLRGTGQKAVFTRRLTATLTNDLMELTGTPAVLAATNIVIRNKTIALDLSSHKLTTPGRYNFRGPLPASATNLFRPPNGS